MSRESPDAGEDPAIRPAVGSTRRGVSETTVTPDYTTHGSRFTGKISWVQLDLGEDDNDQFIDPEERLRVAMARQ